MKRKRPFSYDTVWQEKYVNAASQNGISDLGGTLIERAIYPRIEYLRVMLFQHFCPFDRFMAN